MTHSNASPGSPGGSSAAENPLDRFVRAQGLLVLDGGLATALEERGHDLNDPLWSAKLLIEDPGAIRDLHRTYLEVGADCLITATYQASREGFRRRGQDAAAADALMRLAVRLAGQARDEFWAEPANRQGRLRPLVAASIGPYGAFLADGSEYRGDYPVSAAELADFHRDRLHLLAGAGADLLACETIPSAGEARVLLDLLREVPDCWAWFSFSCRDGAHLCDGTPLAEVVPDCAAAPRLAAVGINCTAPGYVVDLVTAVRSVCDLPVVVYPNLGERYDAARKAWEPGEAPGEWLIAASAWRELGVVGIGGCCRVGPALIGELRRRLLG